MVLDGGAISTSAITSSFTAILRISQAVYELKAVGEQTRDLLDTTKYVNSSLESVRGLRRQKSDLLNREEKRWIDQQVEFTQKAVDGVAVLIERARVDMAAKTDSNNEDDFKTKHIKIHHRARFVLEDGPKVQTNLMKVTMAMNGLNSAMVTLSSREGHDARLAPPKGGHAPGRRSTSPGNMPPPYAAGDFLNRRRTVASTVADSQRRHLPQQVGFIVPEEPRTSQILQPRTSMSSITPSIHFTSSFGEPYDENALADDTNSPACVPTSSIRDSVGSDAHFIPTELNAQPPSSISLHSAVLQGLAELDAHSSLSPQPTVSHGPTEMDASAHPPLHSHHSEPAVSRRIPPVPRNPLAYQTHRPDASSISSMNEEFEQSLTNNPRGPTTPRASRSPAREAQKALPMLPLHPTPSLVSLNSTFSDPSGESSSSSSIRGPPPVSRGRSWLLDRANQAAAGNTTPLSRTQSNDLPCPTYVRETPRAWPG